MKRFTIFFLGLIGAGIFILMGCNGPTAMNESSASVRHLTAGEFETEVVKATNAVVVDFYATWCGPCRELSPMLDRLAGDHTNQIKFVKINVDEAPELAKRYQVEGIPTLIFFKGGEVTDRQVGLLPEAELKSKLEAFAAGK